MEKIFKYPALVLVVFYLFIFIVPKSEARDASQITDWYIKDFQSEIVARGDSSLLITEKITADAGNLPDKHGIFRILPLFYQETATKRVETPIKLISITDKSGQSYNYSTSRTRDTISYKIGDANKTVKGESYYQIVYEVRNAIRLDGDKFDEFYWNLNGNFWDLEIDKYSATISFPDAPLSKTIDLYSGQFGENYEKIVSYRWEDDKKLIVTASEMIRANEGITVSVNFAKGTFSPYVPSTVERFGKYLWMLLPLITFITCYRFWQKNGRDPKLHKAEMVQYEPPAGLGPIEMGMMERNLSFDNKYISAAIVDLAVKGVVKISEIEKKGLLGKKDFEIEFLQQDFSKVASLTAAEKKLAHALLGYAKNNVFRLKSLENKFYTKISAIKDTAKNTLIESNYFTKAGFSAQNYLVVILVVAIIVAIFLSSFMFDTLASPGWMIGSFVLVIVVITVFMILMPSRTKAGEELDWQIQGFKLFMTKAEKYRAVFDEKQGLFEKYLPYAMIFGITHLWVENIKKIYGEEYFHTYHPIWYYGSLANFNADSFTQSMTELSSTMAATVSSSPSSSGSGGGGFSGGGGGGGGGGGW